jgi:Co/Zn/Cd efflux system component
MKESSNFWFFVRLALTLLAIPIWLVIRSNMQDDFSQPPKWYFVCASVGFAFFSVLSLSMLRTDKEWRVPSWFANPLDQNQPLEGMHLAGWSFVLGSIGLLISGMLGEPNDWSWAIPGCIGVGLLLGVRTVARRSGL